METHISSVSIAYFLYASLVLLCPLFSLNKAYGVIEQNKTMKNYLHSYDVKVSSLLESAVCNQSSKVHNKGSSTLEVVHKYGPCVQLLNQGKARNIAPTQIEMLVQDQSRVDSIGARFSKNLSQFNALKKKQSNTLPIQSGITLGTSNYVVTVALGTPKMNFTLIFDTGSDITWTQCLPCIGSCYQQIEPKFDPTKSTSYRNISCSSISCKLISISGGDGGCSSSTFNCIYRVKYSDGSYSIGYFAKEKLTIASSDVFKNFIFGCGQKNAGKFGQEAGLLGLGLSELSLVSQTAKKYKKLFSYCIPSSQSSIGHLTFGGRMPKKVKFTPLTPDSKITTLYGLDITGIKVGGRKLSIDRSVFKNTGAIIDSGTVITRLPRVAYATLSSAFKEMMKDYNTTSGISIFETCYDLSNHERIFVPEISFLFKGGVEVDIVVSGILIGIGSLKKVCLAFAANSDDSFPTIFGNSQQKSYEVVYDVAKGRVGFAPRGCS